MTRALLVVVFVVALAVLASGDAPGLFPVAGARPLRHARAGVAARLLAPIESEARAQEALILFVCLGRRDGARAPSPAPDPLGRGLPATPPPRTLE